MFDQPSQHESPFGMNSPRRPGLLGVVCGLVVFGIAGSLWFAYPKLTDHDPSRAQWESVHKSVDALGGRLDQQKSKLTEWSNNQDQLRDQIAAFRREMRSRIETARKQANRSAEELFDRAQKQEQTDTQEASAKLARLELSRDADQTQIAQLQEDLARTRQEAAQQAAALNEVRQQIAENGASAEQKLASLQATEDRDRRDVDTINDKLAVRRVDFEVGKGKSEELAPGISLEISGTDVSFRRVSGWMWVLPDRRTIWLHDQAAQQPVVFYGYPDGQKRELVITNVSKGAVAGYLLLPKDANGKEAAFAETAAPAVLAAASE